MAGYCISCMKQVDCVCVLLEKKFCNIECKKNYQNANSTTNRMQGLPNSESPGNQSREENNQTYIE